MPTVRQTLFGTWLFLLERPSPGSSQTETEFRMDGHSETEFGNEVKTLREHLGRNVQEALALEVAFLEVFGA